MLDIVVVNYRTPELTAQCLRSLADWTRVDHSVTLVDNGSDDSSAEYLSQAFPDAHLIRSRENLGYARACNLGAEVGSGEHLIFLNSDILALPGWDQPLLDCLESDERIAVVGPKLVTIQNLIVGAGVVGTNDHPVVRGWLQPDQGQFDEPLDCLSVSGAAFAVKRRLIPILGLFDERYFFYWEEMDYAYAARSQGYRVVYCPASKLIHHCNQTTGRFPVGDALDRGRDLFITKWRHLMDGPPRLQPGVEGGEEP